MDLPSQKSKSVVLETARTRLRPHRYGDFPDVAAFWAEPAVVAYIMPGPLPRSEAWTRLLRYVGHWALLSYGYWVVEDKQSGEFLGEVGFADWKREIEPSVEGLPEIGWAIKTAAQGRGLATEVIEAALGWADQNIEAPESVALINPLHEVSLKIARKAGFGAPETAAFRGSSILILRRPRAP